MKPNVSRYALGLRIDALEAQLEGLAKQRRSADALIDSVHGAVTSGELWTLSCLCVCEHCAGLSDAIHALSVVHRQSAKAWPEYSHGGSA